jgi:hypothetical protein
MNRKEVGCATIGMLIGAAGCSAPVKSLFVPNAYATESGRPSVAPNADFPIHVVIHYHLAIGQSAGFFSEQVITATSSSDDVNIGVFGARHLLVTGIQKGSAIINVVSS